MGDAIIHALCECRRLLQVTSQPFLLSPHPDFQLFSNSLLSPSEICALLQKSLEFFPLDIRRLQNVILEAWNGPESLAKDPSGHCEWRSRWTSSMPMFSWEDRGGGPLFFDFALSTSVKLAEVHRSGRQTPRKLQFDEKHQEICHC